MKTILILVGKTVNKHFIAGIEDYSERISHYMPFEIVTIPELRNTKNLSEEQQKISEGDLILRQIQPSDTVVLLDEHGKEFRSIEYARWLQQKQQTARRLVFVIGGPYGFSDLSSLSSSTALVPSSRVNLITTSRLRCSAHREP